MTLSKSEITPSVQMTLQTPGHWKPISDAPYGKTILVRNKMTREGKRTKPRNGR